MLVVHRSADATVLAHALADVLRTPPADPFTRDVVAVPAKGVERWLAQRLAHVLGAAPGDLADGVCANVDFPSPARLLDEVAQSALPERADAVARWTPERAVWPLLEVLDSCLGESWCAPLRAHLGGERDLGRRFRVASKLARLFDSYAAARPAMLLAWARGEDEQGDGLPLPEDLAWQTSLWRLLRERLDCPSPAELLAEVCSRLRAAPDLSDLPERVSVFGASRLEPARLAVLDALSAGRDVHLWLNHWSPALWRAGEAAPPPVRRSADQARAALTNPLLASLSRDVLELQQLLRRVAPHAEHVLHGTPAGGSSLLARLKQDLADDTVPVAPAPLVEGDRSIQVHACHGRTRQVEVLREVVLGLLADDPTLEPRDVLVMCPDIEAFAPLIAATFALGNEEAAHPAARLRVRLADRSLRQTNDLFAVLAVLLELGTTRVSSTQVLDLASAPAVSRRFGLDDDVIERLRDWVSDAGVRWGLDAKHRQAWQLGKLEQGTWRLGLDRLLVGATLQAGQGGLGEVAPLDDVDSADIDLVGRFAELVDRLDSVQELLAGRHTVQVWLEGLEASVLSLAAPTRDDAWQELQLHGELAELAEQADGTSTLLSLPDVQALLEGLLAGRPTRAGFRTGTLTVCTLVPMRSVPHRVVCLLGLDDGSFPRQSTRDGDDILARDPWTGERDPRSEDRQLLLDAIGAAEEHLVITYTGADERTGAPVPPAVPLGELLDALDRTAEPPVLLELLEPPEPREGQATQQRAGLRRRVRDVITTRHPLQPFDERNFCAGALDRPGPFSFDAAAHVGAQAGRGGRTERPALLRGPLAPRPPDDVQLSDLLRLLEHPARGFLRQRLELAVTREEEEPSDALPIELDGLAAWAVGERMLQDRIAGRTPQECAQRELQRGALPPGALGAARLRSIGREVEALVEASAGECALPAGALDVDLLLDDGTRLSGTVLGVRGEVLLSLGYSSLSAKQRLRAWVELVAVSAAHAGAGYRAVTVGRFRKGAKRCSFAALEPDEARVALHELVGLYRAGLRAPLPLPVKTAAAYAEARHRGSRVPAAQKAAEARWHGDKFPGEQADAEHHLLYGVDATLDVLTAQPPWPEEAGPGWPTDEPDRFGLLAQRLWRRLLDAEQVD